MGQVRGFDRSIGSIWSDMLVVVSGGKLVVFLEEC